MGIPILAEIERLITEHGSAAILKERLALASDQYAALEKKVSESNLRTDQLQSENDSLRLDLEKAQQKVRNLEGIAKPNSNPSGYVCDHCGSSNINRTGSRQDPIFGDLGVKQAVFLCGSCGKESSFQQKPM